MKNEREPCCLCSAPTAGIYTSFAPERCKHPEHHKDSAWRHAVCDRCWTSIANDAAIQRGTRPVQPFRVRPDGSAVQ